MSNCKKHAVFVWHFSAGFLLSSVIFRWNRAAFFQLFLRPLGAFFLSLPVVIWKNAAWFIAISWCVFIARPIERVHRAHSVNFRYKNAIQFMKVPWNGIITCANRGKAIEPNNKRGERWKSTHLCCHVRIWQSTVPFVFAFSYLTSARFVCSAWVERMRSTCATFALHSKWFFNGISWNMSFSLNRLKLTIVRRKRC